MVRPSLQLTVLSILGCLASCAASAGSVPQAAIPTATPDQVAWLGQGRSNSSDMAVFIHYNIVTSSGMQDCGCEKGAPPPISSWNPSALDTDSWIKAGIAMGATRFVYVAKHSCGFFSYNSSVDYPYSAAHSTSPNADVVSAFAASAKKFGVGFGFYYSVTTNRMCNVCKGKVQPNPAPGQLNLTQHEYDSIVLAHLTELWGNFGPLVEIWFDGGYQESIKANLTALLARLQPHAVVPGGFGLNPSPVRWAGGEAGRVPYPSWSTASNGDEGAGSANGTIFIPAESDFTFQNNDRWFYDPAAGLHTPAQLRKMYETSVGHNSPVIIDFAPMPNGTVPPAQFAAAETLGSFIRGCYGKPLAAATDNERTVKLPEGNGTIDRVMIQEDYAADPRQLVRSFTLIATLVDGKTVNLLQGYNGTSVGAKFIAILDPPVHNVTSVSVNITSQAAPATLRFLGVYSCSSIANQLDMDWKTRGFNTNPQQGVPAERSNRLPSKVAPLGFLIRRLISGVLATMISSFT